MCVLCLEQNNRSQPCLTTAALWVGAGQTILLTTNVRCRAHVTPTPSTMLILNVADWKLICLHKLEPQKWLACFPREIHGQHCRWSQLIVTKTTSRCSVSKTLFSLTLMVAAASSLCWKEWKEMLVRRSKYLMGRVLKCCMPQEMHLLLCWTHQLLACQSLDGEWALVPLQIIVASFLWALFAALQILARHSHRYLTVVC